MRRVRWRTPGQTVTAAAAVTITAWAITVSTLAEARGAFRQANATLASAEDTIAPGSPVTYQLAMTLEELADAARAIRVLADYIEKNPNSLVFGRAQVNP